MTDAQGMELVIAASWESMSEDAQRLVTDELDARYSAMESALKTHMYGQKYKDALAKYDELTRALPDDFPHWLLPTY